MIFDRYGPTQTVSAGGGMPADGERARLQIIEAATSAGRFRDDLWYRLNAFPIHMPPLRERREDITLLVDHFIARFSEKTGKPSQQISTGALKMLQNYNWPGNVRELENLIERAVVSSRGKHLHIEAPIGVPASSATTRTLKETEREHIMKALNLTYWKIDGPHGAARLLGLNPSTLRHRIKRHGLQRPMAIGDS